MLKRKKIEKGGLSSSVLTEYMVDKQSYFSSSLSKSVYWPKIMRIRKTECEGRKEKPEGLVIIHHWNTFWNSSHLAFGIEWYVNDENHGW